MSDNIVFTENQEAMALAMAKVFDEQDWNVINLQGTCTKCSRVKSHYGSTPPFCSGCGGKIIYNELFDDHVKQLLLTAFTAALAVS